jgi:hypothetical protein
MPLIEADRTPPEHPSRVDVRMVMVAGKPISLLEVTDEHEQLMVRIPFLFHSLHLACFVNLTGYVNLLFSLQKNTLTMPSWFFKMNNLKTQEVMDISFLPLSSFLSRTLCFRFCQSKTSSSASDQTVEGVESFLLESVVAGSHQARYSFVGSS